uniref:Metalloendopeptidase n=1 Tax=Parastrongyloides trichosuri TaxID=131310 RepID=A0A0N4ZJQ7_PARTI
MGNLLYFQNFKYFLLMIVGAFLLFNFFVSAPLNNFNRLKSFYKVSIKHVDNEIESEQFKYFKFNIFRIPLTNNLFPKKPIYNIHHEDITGKVIKYMNTSTKQTTTFIHFNINKTLISEVICIYCTLDRFIDKKKLHLIHFSEITMDINKKNIFGSIFLGNFCGNFNKSEHYCSLYKETEEIFNKKEIKKNKEIDFYKSSYVNLNCEDLVAGNKTYIKESAKNRIVYDKNISLSMDCESIYKRGFDLNQTLTDIEKKYSIAYAWNVYKNYEIIEMKLRMQYSPNNHYCYVVDSKSPSLLKEMLELEKCLPNVYVSKKSFDMKSNGEQGPVAHYECMKLLLPKKWDYLFILLNDAIPLLTNNEQLEILEAMSFPLVMRVTDATHYIPSRVNTSASWLYKDLDIFLEGDLRKNFQFLSNINMTFHCGLVDSGIPRQSIEYIVNKLNITKYLKQLNTNMYASDELVWPTLFGEKILKVPDGVSRKCAPTYFPHEEYFAKQLFWGGGCGTNIVHHSICTWGLETLPLIKTFTTFFGNYSYVSLVSFYLYNILYRFSIVESFDKNYNIFNKREKRQVVVAKESKWDLSVPYYLSYYMDNWYVRKAISEVETFTCIKFVREYNEIKDKNGINFYYNYDYYAKSEHFGKKKEKEPQYITASYYEYKDTGLIQRLIHETLGIMEMHSHPNRDKWIKIIYDNIEHKNYDVFNISKSNETYGIGYDFASIMQYGPKEYSKNDKETIIPRDYKDRYKFMMGQLEVATFNDYKLLNKYYCSNECDKKPEKFCGNGGYPNPKNCDECVCPIGFEGENCTSPPASYPSKCGSNDLWATTSSQNINVNYVNYCAYRILTTEGKKIQLTFDQSFTVSDGEKCTISRGIQVKYQKDMGSTGLLLCRHVQQGLTIKSEENIMIVIVRSPYPDSYVRFSYKQVD